MFLIFFPLYGPLSGFKNSFRHQMVPAVNGTRFLLKIVFSYAILLPTEDDIYVLNGL